MTAASRDGLDEPADRVVGPAAAPVGCAAGVPSGFTSRTDMLMLVSTRTASTDCSVTVRVSTSTGRLIRMMT
jgi:hypothetical protein